MVSHQVAPKAEADELFGGVVDSDHYQCDRSGAGGKVEGLGRGRWTNPAQAGCPSSPGRVATQSPGGVPALAGKKDSPELDQLTGEEETAAAEAKAAASVRVWTPSLVRIRPTWCSAVFAVM